jgi:hypothetical protein
MDEPVIILDADQNVILVSILTEKLLGPNYINIFNKGASAVAKKNGN